MAVQPAAAQTAGLQHPKPGGENMTATEMKRKQGNDELPCPSIYALWKECFYKKVQQRCLSLQETKVKMVHEQKVKEEKVNKREPCDLLSREWFNNEKVSLDTRIYLLEKLLPTLIPGIEKLLMEVERKNMLAAEEPAQFNPFIFLGEYLIRHNPQYGIPTKPGPYLRGLKVVTEELKSEMAGTASERLARMKAEAKVKRKEKEELENMKSQVKLMRKEALAIQFKEWTVDMSGRIPIALVQSALRTFADVIASTATDVRENCDRKLEIVDTLEKKVNIDEFTEVFVSCNFCGKSISYSCSAIPHQGRGFSQYGVSGSPTKSKVTSCPGCRKPLPRCALCLINMGTPVSSCPGGSKSDEKVDLSKDKKLAQFNNWFTWCHNCRHGGHAGHMLSWFRDHTECPVSACSCKCMQLDTTGNLIPAETVQA